ncbi:MAG: methionine adenosyltransferase domain-containing protein [Prevotella sp.]|nr:methionine adenosyltransferase domain-containing protein [Prevotella sp.]
MNSCSEYVASGHPDKVADLIASYLLDEYIKNDPKTRFALEVQLKDHICNLAGEITSRWQPTTSELAFHVKEAIRKVGYTAEYAAKWPKDATLNADHVLVNNFIGQQSPNIAQGVDREGWGDQGCFMGMATTNGRSADYGYMPRDRYFSHEIGRRLYNAALNGEAPIGLDIKVLVSLTNGLNVEQIVVAAPMLPENELVAKKFISDIVQDVLSEHHHTLDDLLINGTGSFVIHSSVGDAGVVGRKLAVDFYGLNCPIGGGSPWGKDATKADVTLNIAARYFALKELLSNPARKTVYCKIACCIGQRKCLIAFSNESNIVFKQDEVDIVPSEIIHKFGLDGTVRNDMFFHLCKDGLFTEADKIAINEAKA